MAQATPQIFERLIAARLELPAIGKTRRAPDAAGGYRYRGIDDFLDAAGPVLARHGVTVLPRVIASEVREVQTASGKPCRHVVLTVEHHWFAPDGSTTPVPTTTVGEAMDTGDKAANKAMAAALKYALAYTLMVPLNEPEQDTEAEHHETGAPLAHGAGRPVDPPAPVRPTGPNLSRLRTLIDEHGLTEEQQAAWCCYFKVERLEQLAQGQVDAIVAKVERVVRGKGA